MDGWLDITDKPGKTALEQIREQEAILLRLARSKGIHCDRWAVPVAHPTQKGRYAYRIKPIVAEGVLEACKQSFCEQADMLKEGYFPKKKPTGVDVNPTPTAFRSYGAIRTEGAGQTAYVPPEPKNYWKYVGWAVAAAGAAGALYHFLG